MGEDGMNNNYDDEFLYKNHPPVREEFANRLYYDISNNKKESKNDMTMRTFSWIWRFAAVIILLAVMLFTLSTGVRASVLEWIKTVAGFNVEEQSESPLRELDDDAITSRDKTPMPTLESTPQVTLEALTPTIYPVKTAPLPQILQNPPFEFGIPQYIPEGYALSDEAGEAQSKNWVMISWGNQDGAEIEMLVEKSYSGYNIPAGIESTREVQVNGKPALMILGFWGENHTWNPNLSAALHWQIDDIHYTLTFWSRSKTNGSIQPVENIEAVADELVKIAESVQ
jgi:hypothetical protein